MSPETGVFPQPARFTRVTARRLAHHPEDGFVSWLHSLRFLHECNPSYGVLTLSPVGLSPTEHASFSLDALWSKNSISLKTRDIVRLVSRRHADVTRRFPCDVTWCYAPVRATWCS